MASKPLLWSFRRCPFAIRARLAIAAAGLRPGSDLELREVDLACRPPELREVWPVATVPLLQLSDGVRIGESLEIMRWALARRDPQGWLRLPERSEALIAENDGPFKHHLDRFKYAGRHPGEDPQRHRLAALVILRRWEALLQRGEADPSAAAATASASPDAAAGRWLLGPRSSLADWALLPFVRQFRLADPDGFDAEPGLAAVRAWLARFEAGPELAAVMAPPFAFRQPWRSRRWIYHLALSEEWREARAEGVYRRSSRGLSLEQVGFIHASHARQIAASFDRFYADAGPVQLLTIDPQRLAEAGIQVVEEEAAEGTGERFPHIHGPLPCSAVLAAEPYRP